MCNKNNEKKLRLLRRCLWIKRYWPQCNGYYLRGSSVKWLPSVGILYMSSRQFLNCSLFFMSLALPRNYLSDSFINRFWFAIVYWLQLANLSIGYLTLHHLRSLVVPVKASDPTEALVVPSNGICAFSSIRTLWIVLTHVKTSRLFYWLRYLIGLFSTLSRVICFSRPSFLKTYITVSLLYCIISSTLIVMLTAVLSYWISCGYPRFPRHLFQNLKI